MRREVIIVLGKTGCGKSWWAKHAVQASERLAVFDPLQSPEYRVAWVEPEDTDALEGQYRQKQFRVGVYDPDSLPSLGSYAFAYGGPEVMEYHGTKAWFDGQQGMATGPLTLVLEEFSTITEKGQRPPDWLRRLIFLGRHKGVSLVAVAQRAVSIPIELRSQASRIVSFAQHEADDVDWLEEFYGPDVADELPDLPKFECVDYRLGGTVERYSIRPTVQATFGVDLSKKEDEVQL